MTARRPLRRTPFATELFGADLRALAVFRIALALVVIADLLARSSDLSAHYTDAGVLRRSDLLEAFSWLHAWPVCVHLIGGALWSQVMLFGLHGLFAVAMLVGYRTRVATFLVWLLTMSLQLRNLYIGHGSDAELRMMLFWGCFLPLGARYSIDSALGPAPRDPRPPQRLSVGSVALLTQIVIIYASTGYAKSLHLEWTQGTAVASALNNELWGTRAGLLLLLFPGLCRWLTHAVLALELATPFLLFVPVFVGPIRTATVFALACMHLGFGLGLRVGIFPWISIAAVLCLLPPWFWDAFLPRIQEARAVSHLRRRLATPPTLPLVARFKGFVGARLHPGPGGARLPSRWSARLRDGFCTVFLAYTVFWNIGVVRDPAYEAPHWIEWLGSTLFLQQDWRMFASIAARTGWMVIPGKLRNGTQLDLFGAGGPLPHPNTGPAAAPQNRAASDPGLYRVKDYRWLGFIDRLAFGKRGEQQLLLYGRYLCREWNARHAGLEQMDSLEIFFMSRPVKPEFPQYPDDDYEKVLLWTHDCFG